MFCTKCGKEIPDGTECDCTQQAQQQQPPQQQQFQQQPPPPQQQQQFQQQPFQPQQPIKQDNRKLFCFLSYIGILWIIGIVVAPEKDDQRVRFHVGQGIMLSIYSFGLQIASTILTSILGAIWKTQIYVFGYPTGEYMRSPVVGVIGILLNLAIWGSTIALAVMAILNINKDQDKPLPIIGNFAFYK